MVFFEFTVTDEMPGAFVLCKDGDDPEYLEYEEGLDKLGIIEDEIGILGIPYGDDSIFSNAADEDEYPDTAESEEMPEDIFERFDKAYQDGKPDIEAYREYLDIVMSQSPYELRKYLELFRG